MTIIRTPRKERNFTVLSNSVCLDYRLSMKALGMLVRLLSRPDNWKTNSECLAREFGVGRDQIRNILNELQEFGYMQLVKSQNELGQWSSVWYVFDEANEQITTTEKVVPKPENQGLGKPCFGVSGPITRTDLTRTDNKPLLFQFPVKQENEKFIQFWQIYPRKTNKSYAQKVFLKLNPSDELFLVILKSLQKYPFSKDQQYIPHPSTWLNNKRWEDEIQEQELSAYDKLMMAAK